MFASCSNRVLLPENIGPRMSLREPDEGRVEGVGGANGASGIDGVKSVNPMNKYNNETWVCGIER